MTTDSIFYYPSVYNKFDQDEVYALADGMLIYSMNHLAYFENISEANILEALQKALQLCHLAGMNSKHHFKQIFLFDSTAECLLIDWRMSRTGFNLVILQLPSPNKNIANWVSKLAAR